MFPRRLWVTPFRYVKQPNRTERSRILLGESVLAESVLIESGVDYAKDDSPADPRCGPVYMGCCAPSKPTVMF